MDTLAWARRWLAGIVVAFVIVALWAGCAYHTAGARGQSQGSSPGQSQEVKVCRARCIRWADAYGLWQVTHVAWAEGFAQNGTQ